jgi:LCP family protein required for cell wall assembly
VPVLDDLAQLQQDDQQGDPPARRARPKRRRGRRILAAVVALVLLVAVGAGAYLLFLNQTVANNVTHENLLPAPSPTAGPGSGKQLVQGAGDNILLIGSDARPGETYSRSDVIVLMHISEDRKKVYLIHFPRDMYVSIPGHGKNKINAAFAFGRTPLLVSTLQDMLGVKIDHAALIGFEGFKRMTDAVGGVHVWAEEASSGKGNGGPVVIHKGWNDLNGEQALAFVRERYELSEGDISRGRRQQAFIKALMLKGLSKETVTNPITLAKFISAGTENLTVDNGFDMGEMRSLGLSLRNVRGDDIEFITAPITGFGSTSQGASIDIVNEPLLKLMGEELQGDTMEDYVARQ